MPVCQKKVSNFVNVVNQCLAAVFDGPYEVLDESIANNPIRMVIDGDNSEALSRIEAASHEAGVDIMVRTVLENDVPLEYVTAK